MSMYLPIAVIVLSNILYNICTKSTPETADLFASLTITYLVGAAVSAVLYFALHRGGNLLEQCRSLNWTSWALGLSIVGLEAGSIYMYKAGWNISTGHLVHSSLLAVCLLLVGVLFYRETVSVSKLCGVAICLVGLYFLNR